MSNPTGLKPRARTWAEQCGCVTDGSQWIDLCDEHHAEFAGMHAAAMAGVSYVPGKPPSWYATDDNPDPWS